MKDFEGRFTGSVPLGLAIFQLPIASKLLVQKVKGLLLCRVTGNMLALEPRNFVCSDCTVIYCSLAKIFGLFNLLADRAVLVLGWLVGPKSCQLVEITVSQYTDTAVL